ncbi:MAG: Type 1 glutamine amidotransferase-like domain-containing protein [Patescibacteria group bacterium]
MRRIIAIGGGEIGRPGTSIETLFIDKETIKLTGKKNPKLLFIPTASSDSSSYAKVVSGYFGDKLGCKVSTLYLINKKHTNKELRRKILNTDIIYVGGGNTKKMLLVWKKNNLYKILQEAYNKGVVLSGLSAGAICWFKYGNSDSMSFYKKNSPYIRVSGLNLVNMLLCPHYDIEKGRRLSLKKMMSKTSGTAIALENCSAIEIIDDQYRIISSKKKANAYKAFWLNGKYINKALTKTQKFKPIDELFRKK